MQFFKICFIHHLNLHYLTIFQHQYYQYYINNVFNQNHSYYEPVQVFVNVSSIHRSTLINRTDQTLKSIYRLTKQLTNWLYREHSVHFPILYVHTIQFRILWAFIVTQTIWIHCKHQGYIAIEIVLQFVSYVMFNVLISRTS